MQNAESNDSPLIKKFTLVNNSVKKFNCKKLFPEKQHGK